MTDSETAKRLRLAVLISGSGSTLANLLQCIRQGSLSAEVVLVVASSPQAKGIRFAVEADIPHHIIQTREFDSVESFSERIFSECRHANVDLAVMGGFLKRVTVPSDFENRVLNVHPSLIPSFCGKGFYGSRVHQAVIDYGAKISGCTIHFVDDEYDHGPILSQTTVPVLPADSAEILAARVIAQERIAYPEAIQLIAENRVSIDGRRVFIS